MGRFVIYCALQKNSSNLLLCFDCRHISLSNQMSKVLLCTKHSFSWVREWTKNMHLWRKRTRCYELTFVCPLISFRVFTCAMVVDKGKICLRIKFLIPVDLQVLIKIMQIIDIYLILFNTVENNVYQRPVRKPTLKWRIHW